MYQMFFDIKITVIKKNLKKKKENCKHSTSLSAVPRAFVPYCRIIFINGDQCSGVAIFFVVRGDVILLVG